MSVDETKITETSTSEEMPDAGLPTSASHNTTTHPAQDAPKAPSIPTTINTTEEPTMDAPAPPIQNTTQSNGHTPPPIEAQAALDSGKASYQNYIDDWTDEIIASAEEIAARPIPAITPPNTWPPPLFIRPQATAREIYYMQYRWYSQWNYYDSKASTAKKVHQRLQLIIAVGSVVVPVLIGLTPTDPTLRTTLDLITVGISLIVAASAAIETVKSYGDDWRNYRSAAEELKREKSLYDAGSGSYRRAKNPFLLFVERSEDIMAKQNGAWAALKEESKADKEDEGRGGAMPSGIPNAGTSSVIQPGSDDFAG